jgi:hypothetical protein
MPEYTYHCPYCSSYVKLLRKIADVYEEVTCLNCTEKFDAMQCKILDRTIGAYYPGGQSKGRMNNKGDY